MMKIAAVVAIRFGDGSVGRMQLYERRSEAADGQLVVNDWTDEDIQAEIEKGVFTQSPVSWRRATLADFPDEHAAFRAAWVDSGKGISVDMIKARAITRDRLRAERAPLLAAKDVEVIKALESGDQTKVAEVAADKQRLRDITALPAIDAAKTPDDLRAISLESRAPGVSRV